MARKLAGKNLEGGKGEEEWAWEENGMKFRKVPGAIHGFTHPPKKGEEEVQRQRDLEVLYKEVAEWLRQ